MSDNLSKKKSYSFATKLVLVIVVVFIALLSLELVVRAYKYYKPSKKYVNTATDAYEKKGEDLSKYDPISLMRFSGYQVYTPLENHKGKGYFTNSAGFRHDEDIPLKKPDGELRIFITGGSTAWGFGASQENMYSTIAENILQERFPDIKIRVINAGVGAYLSTHERILILNKIYEYEPDILVMFTGWNDGYAAYRGTRVLDDRWDYLNAGQALAENFSNVAKYEDLNVIEKLDAPEYEDYTIKLQHIIEKVLYKLNNPSDNIKEKIKQIKIEPEYVVKDLANNLTTISDLSKRQGFSLVFYLQPSLYNTRKDLSESESFIIEEDKKNLVLFPELHSEIYDLYRKELPIVAQKEDFIFIDSDVAISGETKTVFVDPVHVGGRGNRLLGEHLASVLYDEVIKVTNKNSTSATKTNNQ